MDELMIHSLVTTLTICWASQKVQKRGCGLVRVTQNNSKSGRACSFAGDLVGAMVSLLITLASEKAGNLGPLKLQNYLKDVEFSSEIALALIECNLEGRRNKLLQETQLVNADQIWQLTVQCMSRTKYLRLKLKMSAPKEHPSWNKCDVDPLDQQQKCHH